MKDFSQSRDHEPMTCSALDAANISEVFDQWLHSFGAREMQFISAREHAVAAVLDIRDEVMRRLGARAGPEQPQCEPMHPDDEGWSEWIHPLPGYLMQCCDCNLVHEMEVAIGETIDKGGPLNDGEDENSVVIFRMRRWEPSSAEPAEREGSRDTDKSSSPTLEKGKE